MNNMNGWAAKSRGGAGVGSITKGHAKSSGKSCGHKEASPQPKKLLTGKVDEKMVQPSAKAKMSR